MPLLRRLTGEQKRTVAHWAMELVVVVAGVLIALWLQQWVEQRRAIGDMRAAENAIHDEVRGALTSLIWREAISQCHFNRASLLKAGLTGKSDQWPGLDENALVTVKPGPGRYSAPTIFPSVYQRPVDTFTMSAWNSALATGALAPMDRKRFGQLIAVYDQIQLLIKIREIEDRAAEELSVLAFPTRLTPEIRTELLQGLYEIDRTRFAFAAYGPMILADQMRQLGWNDKVEVDRWIDDDAADDRKNGIVWRSCVAKPKNPFDTPAK